MENAITALIRLAFARLRRGLFPERDDIRDTKDWEEIARFAREEKTMAETETPGGDDSIRQQLWIEKSRRQVQEQISQQLRDLFVFLGIPSFVALLTFVGYAAYQLMVVVPQVASTEALASLKRQFETQLKTLDAQRDRMRDQLSSVQAEIATNDKLLEAVKGAAEKLKSDVGALKQSTDEKALTIGQTLGELEGSLAALQKRRNDVAGTVAKFENKDVQRAVDLLEADKPLQQLLAGTAATKAVLLLDSAVPCPDGWVDMPGVAGALLAGTSANATTARVRSFTLTERQIPRMEVNHLWVPVEPFPECGDDCELLGSAVEPAGIKAMTSVSGRVGVKGAFGYLQPNEVSIDVGPTVAVRACVRKV